MKLNEILCEYEIVYVDEDNEILSEASVRQWKRVGKKIVKKYRCTAGMKQGKLVNAPGDCSQRKDPTKVRQGRKVMRSKKGMIQRKAKVTKRTSFSKMVTKMNKRLMGKT